VEVVVFWLDVLLQEITVTASMSMATTAERVVPRFISLLSLMQKDKRLLAERPHFSIKTSNEAGFKRVCKEAEAREKSACCQFAGKILSGKPNVKVFAARCPV
jgi:hypothetical protein